MNAIRERILLGITPYQDYDLCRDLVAIGIGSEYFVDCEDDENDIELDFEELIVVVEKDWLFLLMAKEGIENPLEYLKNEYTWDDSISWYDEAVKENKVVMVSFV